MKIAVIGAGLVGSTAAYALVMRGVGREIVLVDLNEKCSLAEADDIYHAVPFAHPLNVHSGNYADIQGADLVIISAGVNQQPGETRLELLSRNAAVFRQIVPAVLKVAPGAILLVATNPVDVMTHLTAQFAAEFGLPSSRVIGSGTTLDTARFRVLLGRHLQIDAHLVHAYVLGEHGDSEVLAWSQVTIAGLPLDEFCRQRNMQISPEIRQEIDANVRGAAYSIIEGKGATYYGIGSAIARISEIILKDQRAALTVSTPIANLYGIEDVTVAMPNILGGQGVIQTLMQPLTPDEQQKLIASATIVKEAITALN